MKSLQQETRPADEGKPELKDRTVFSFFFLSRFGLKSQYDTGAGPMLLKKGVTIMLEQKNPTD